MTQKIKNFFLNLKWNKKRLILAYLIIKKKFLFLVLLSIVLGLILPIQPVQAQAWLPRLIASWLMKATIRSFITIPLILFGVAEWLLRFILSPDFISVSYTTNDFVTLGWTLTRDFANMFIIIILVVIGLATALRLGEYQWQKTLPLLIGIALLINFTPVILGIIIDASNIVMNFFVEAIAKEGMFVPRMEQYLHSVDRIIDEVDWAEASSYFAILSVPLVYVIFNFIAAIIYFLFCLLFILRYVALWTLVILSPIAFLCYILPATRGIFSLWWKQFIQWCIIGVAAAFFLYLGDVLLLSASELGIAGEIEGWGIANQIIPYFVVLAFLLFGFFGALATSAMGASAIITGYRKGVSAASRTATQRGWRGTRAAAGAVAAEARRMQHTYRAARRLRPVPLSRSRAAGESIRRYWRRRARPAMRPAAMGRTIVRATRGTWGAIRDTGESFFRATFKVPRTRRGQVLCGTCGGVVPAGASFCPHCGTAI